MLNLTRARKFDTLYAESEESMTQKEIKKALGKEGRKLAGEFFKEEYAKAGYVFGKEFNQVVGISVNKALLKLGKEERIETDKLKGNTADSIAHWIDG